MIYMLCLDVSPLNNNALYDSFYSEMSQFRQKKINSFCMRKDKNLSLGAGILIDAFLKKYGIKEKNMHYKISENGKPFFLNDSDLFFNISHSDTKVIAAFSDREIGCDIEKTGESNLNIAKRFFHPDEYDFLNKIPDIKDQTHSFYRLWTLKESFLKATGFGMKLGMNRFCVKINNNGIFAECDITDCEYSFKEYSFVPGFCIAHCVSGEPEEVVIECKDALLEV